MLAVIIFMMLVYRESLKESCLSYEKLVNEFEKICNFLEKWAVFLSFIRCIGFVQLSLLIMPELFGITGIFLSFLCGELVNCFISVMLYKYAEKSQSNTVKISDKKVLFRNIETD